MTFHKSSSFLWFLFHTISVSILLQRQLMQRAINIGLCVRLFVLMKKHKSRNFSWIGTFVSVSSTYILLLVFIVCLIVYRVRWRVGPRTAHGARFTACCASSGSNQWHKLWQNWCKRTAQKSPFEADIYKRRSSFREIWIVPLLRDWGNRCNTKIQPLLMPHLK